MGLFADVEAHTVVTSDDIRDLTGVSASEFRFGDDTNNEAKLTSLLETWIDRMASHMFVRLGREIKTTDGDYPALQDVLVRSVANLVAVAQQQRTSPIIQIDSFAVNIMNTSEATKHLAEELAPFIHGSGDSTTGGYINVFSSLEEFDAS